MAEVNKRETWSSKADFILTCIGWCVGFSNVWRFPYLCYKNGGGAFLVPYVLTLILCGLPLICLECAMGQYAGQGILTIWDISPLFSGIGVGILVINIIISIYYIFVLALSIRYLVASFTAVVPWSTCDNNWNTKDCVVDQLSRINSTSNTDYQMWNFTILQQDNDSYNMMSNTSISTETNPGSIETNPAEEFFLHHILKLSNGIDNINSLNWQMVLCLVAAWLLVFLTTIKGIKSSGKVVYFTATFPYIMLTCLVIRGISLPGSLHGISYYLIPDFTRLGDSQVWFAAAVQVFYSVGPGQGCFITLSSYHKFHNNCVRDAIITGIMNCATSFYAGFAVFSVLGYMALQMGQPIDTVVKLGPGLAFVTYPQALSTMPLAPLWSILFFFMLILLGIDSELVYFETVITCIQDRFPFLRETKRRIFLLMAMISVFFTVGLIFTSNIGFYIFILIDWYSCAFSLFVIAVMEAIVFCWVYGFERVNTNFQEMFGFSANLYFKLCWKFITPAFVSIIMVFSVVKWTAPTVGSYVYPTAALVFGWLLVSSSLLPIPILAGYVYLRTDGNSFLEKLKRSVAPTKNFLAHIDKRIMDANDDNKDANELIPKTNEDLI